MHARLILTCGSRAGLTAVLQDGVYLIGRDGICQVRPKSRSVSRKHCALFVDGHSLRVLDLGSTTGTKVNGDLIPKRKRFELNNGDELRLGKVTFSVVLGDDGPALLAPDGQTPDEVVKPTAPSMVTGAALKESDIADLLSGLDEEDRAERIATIRHRNEVAERLAREKADEVVEASDFDTDPQITDHPDEYDYDSRDDAENARTASQHQPRKLAPGERRAINARIRRQKNEPWSIQSILAVLLVVVLVAIFAWIIWSNAELFFGRTPKPKDLDY